MGNPTVGEIPDHWEATTLGDVCDRGNGNIQTGPFGSQLHASDYVINGVPSIMPVNIGDNRLIEDNICRISEKDAERLSKHRVLPGDIIYSRRGDVERRALVRDAQRGWLCGTGCIKVRFGDGVVDPAFASFYLDHPQVREWIVQHAVGATMPNLNTSIMRAIPFALPPFDEQLRITSILSALDDKIELNRRMNGLLEGLSRAIFKAWFIDFEPVKAKAAGDASFLGMPQPVFAQLPTSFVNSELGEIPEGWEVGSILERAELLNGGTPKTAVDDYWNGPIKWASAKDVSQCTDAFLIETERTITQNGLDNSSTRIIPRFSIVIVSRGATTGRLTMFGNDIAMNQTCYALRSRNADHFFWYCHLRHSIETIVNSAHGSVFDTITTKTFQSTNVLLPSESMTLAFHHLVASHFELVLVNLQESIRLTSIRDALLPKLISGELNINGVE